eukprot:6186374-Prymnesium_polylepis.2
MAAACARPQHRYWVPTTPFASFAPAGGSEAEKREAEKSFLKPDGGASGAALAACAAELPAADPPGAP